MHHTHHIHLCTQIPTHYIHTHTFLNAHTHTHTHSNTCTQAIHTHTYTLYTPSDIIYTELDSEQQEVNFSNQM